MFYDKKTTTFFRQVFNILLDSGVLNGIPAVWGSWGEERFIFKELESTANYFRGAGEQAHTFGDLGSTVKK